ncbi:MAG: hypothetical protein R3185_09580, partial [Candidatus Thermoplasmatota archaeon]|nr:hypothetical protein [Candidatus Thermoplasmatota archaeon]
MTSSADRGIRRLGYPCTRVGTKEPTVRTCRLANATEERVLQLARDNLHRLYDVLSWNHEHAITL